MCASAFGTECEKCATQSASAFFVTKLRKFCRILIYLFIYQSVMSLRCPQLSEYRAKSVKTRGERLGLRSPLSNHKTHESHEYDTKVVIISVYAKKEKNLVTFPSFSGIIL